MSEIQELRYEYQPVDEVGRPMGGKQVIIYKTQEELIEKIKEQNVLLIRKLREQTRKARLGIEEKEEIGDDVIRFRDPIELTPRELTNEERYEIARRIADPTTSSQATEELLEASLGAPLARVGEILQNIQQDNITLRAKVEVNAFIADTPEYYKCPENYEAITSWMVRYGLAPIKANFQKAYTTLKSQGLLVEGPAPSIPVAEPNIPVVVEEIPVEVPVETPVVTRVPTGLTRDNSSDAGTSVPAGSEITYTLNGKTLLGLAAISAMPSEEYKKRLLTDKGFAKLVDKLESEFRKPRV